MSLLLSTLGVLMMIESTRSLLRRRRGIAARRKLHQHTWLHGLPFKLRFRRSKLYISALLPIILGFLVGMLSAVLGVGGGFVMVPAMIYLLRHADGNRARHLAVSDHLRHRGGDIATSGREQHRRCRAGDGVADRRRRSVRSSARAGARGCAGEELRALLALIVLAVAAKLVFDLTVRPDNLFSLGTLEL